MRVPPFNYPLDDNLLKKINIMIERCVQKNPKRDAVLLFEGAEGEGKTTFSIAVAYYIAHMTGRTFNQDNVFFDVEKMIKFLQEGEDLIAIWDEPALQALSKDSLTTMVKNLERLLLMARKKRHFVLINVAYFNKFSEYVVWQRPLGMIHVYSRRELEPGRYVYIKKRNLEFLWRDWQTKKRRNYKKYCSKSIRGTFPDVLNSTYKNNVLSHFDNASYERAKDAAIMMIGQKPDKVNRRELLLRKELEETKQKLSTLPLETRKLIANALGISFNTISQWRKRYDSNEDLAQFAKEIKEITP